LSFLSIDFISLDNKIDTSKPTGKLNLQIIGAVAEFERDTISERIMAGLRNAKRNGKRVGPPPVKLMTTEKAWKLRAEGLSFRKAGKKTWDLRGCCTKGFKIIE
jgi:putative DNA-invertase from lambdoid prophage Rac